MKQMCGLQNPYVILSDDETTDKIKKNSYLEYIEENGLDADIIIKIADDLIMPEEMAECFGLEPGIITADEICDYRTKKNNTAGEKCVEGKVICYTDDKKLPVYFIDKLMPFLFYCNPLFDD